MINLNYQHLFYFMTVVHSGGFTKASKKLRISQSSISEQVAQFENVIGHRLLNRSTRKIELTESGRTTLKYAESIFSNGKELIEALKSKSIKNKTFIQIGALGSLSKNLQFEFLNPILNQKDVNFSIITGDSKKLLKLLHEHSIDIVLSTHPAPHDEKHLYTQLVSESDLCLVGHSSLKNTIKIKSKEDLIHILENYQTYILSHASDCRSDLDFFFESNEISINLKGELDDIALLRLLALSKRGLVIIPKIGVLNDLKKGTIEIFYEFKDMSQKFYAITRQKKLPNPIISDLLRGLKNNLKFI